MLRLRSPSVWRPYVQCYCFVRRYGAATSRISGRATPTGTSAYCERTNVPLSSMLKPTGWEIGAVGFGGYRISAENNTNRAALISAWKNGVNVVDTSANFNDGSSEQLIGSVLTECVASGEIKRDELVLMTKGGYIQGSMLRHIQQSGIQYDDMIRISDSVWHCISPDFLKLSLDTSLHNLNVDHIEVFFVSNPEVYARGAGYEYLYDRLASTFCGLEDEVTKGRIGCYGIASNAFTTDSKQGFTLERILQVAKDAGGDNHHFRAIQFPFNIYEHTAFLENNGESFMAMAQSKGVWQFTQRTLNVVTPNRTLRRLANFEIDSDSLGERVVECLQTAVTLEDDFDGIASEEIQQAVPVQTRTLAQELTEHTELLNNLYVLEHYLDNTVLPAVYTMCNEVKSIGDEALLDWAIEYEQTMQDLRNLLVSVAQEQTNADNEELAVLLNSVCPSLKSSSDIAEKTIRISLGTGVNSVLIGMTRPEYVTSSLQAAAAEPIIPQDINRILELPLFAPKQVQQ